MTVIQRAARSVANALGRDSLIVRSTRPLYEHALAILSGSRGIPWTINGAEFRISPFHRQRMGAIYDPEVARFLEVQVPAGSVCLDVGANVGVYALQFARWTGQAGRVVAFEPNPVAAAVLAEHIRMNGFDGRVEVVRAAVAEAPGIRTFHMVGADGMSRLGAPNPEIAGQTHAVSVRVTSIDAFCAERGLTPDWLLVDVEGFEFSVLEGARRTIGELGARLRLVVEMHPDAWPVAGWSRASGEALLRELQLVPVSISGSSDPLDHYGHVLLQHRDAPRQGVEK